MWKEPYIYSFYCVSNRFSEMVEGFKNFYLLNTLLDLKHDWEYILKSNWW